MHCLVKLRIPEPVAQFAAELATAGADHEGLKGVAQRAVFGGVVGIRKQDGLPEEEIHGCGEELYSHISIYTFLE